MTPIERLKIAAVIVYAWCVAGGVIYMAVRAIDGVLRWRERRRNYRYEFDLDERYAPRCLNCMIEKGKKK